MRLIQRCTMRYKKLLFADSICVFGFVLIELGLPTVLARIVDKGITPKDMDYIYQQGIWTVVITIIGVAMNILLGYFGAGTTTNIVHDIRDDLLEEIQAFSHSEYENIGASSLIARTTNGAYQIMLFMGDILHLGFMTPVMFIASLYMVVRTSPSSGMYVLGALPFLLLTIVGIARLSEPLSRKQQKNLGGVNGILRENLFGLQVVRAFVNEKFEGSRFNKTNETYTKSSKSLFRLMAATQPGFFFLSNIVIVLIIWSGAVQISHGDLEAGDLIAFTEYIFHALLSFILFASAFMMYPRAAASASQIQEVLDIEPTTREGEGVAETAAKGYLGFRDVTFTYPGHAESPIIHNVSFKVSPGETVAFIGSTGSGRSTLTQLVPRFYGVSEGEILVNKVSVKDYQLSTLRNKIGYIPQEALLFIGTVTDNLRYDKENATLEEMERAIDIAQATEFVSQKPQDYDEPLLESDMNFSGGQRQRLTIARATIRNPGIYISDDSFSTLDYQIDANLRARPKKETTESTVLIAVQRVGTIMHTDRIIVLNEGDVVGIGAYRELLETCPTYYSIAASQLSEEELI